MGVWGPPHDNFIFEDLIPCNLSPIFPTHFQGISKRLSVILNNYNYLLHRLLSLEKLYRTAPPPLKGCQGGGGVVLTVLFMSLYSGGSRGGAGGPDPPPPFGPRYRLFNIGPKVGHPLFLLVDLRCSGGSCG